ncbi:uncharacterized protein ASCRUDRAFT_7800 [Ascoidea rubescens DSM 1968]|uniref:L domain-like protein n=1 Tax=Ascoidea rubescens DSM 1968 TaxID=1344418 RepID=A0A1D2VIZ2_9ASCO|nr:hypothetical protein ASCRUDRAFT_7800 [Ascoidea rubescens DSM 1968]ODV61589.1 hypothetical protein ASCRUDRAFT_7800 [Ascoidea rubescens DSM 1968]
MQLLTFLNENSEYVYTLFNKLPDFVFQRILNDISIDKVALFILSNSESLRKKAYGVLFDTVEVIDQDIKPEYLSVKKILKPLTLKPHLILQIKDVSLFKNQLGHFTKCFVANLRILSSALDGNKYMLPTMFYSLKQLFVLAFFETTITKKFSLSEFDITNTLNAFDRIKPINSNSSKNLLKKRNIPTPFDSSILSNVKCLNILDLFHNQLGMLTDLSMLTDLIDLKHLNNLETLSLSGNNTREIGNSNTLPNLLKLELSSNKLSTNHNLQQFPSLNDLNLGAIDNFRYHSYRVSKIEVLDLRDNRIERIEKLRNTPSWFGVLKSTSGEKAAEKPEKPENMKKIEYDNNKDDKGKGLIKYS